jgi:hypothetical protein
MLDINRYITHSVIFRSVWDDNIKMDLRKLGCEDVDCISLGQGRAH